MFEAMKAGIDYGYTKMGLTMIDATLRANQNGCPFHGSRFDFK
ncbi:hypothetical protein [Tumebacillus lipolyticus]|uniref:Transposase n=1 Tax=Tumebacillus lipolyticus TaxID=1280370 RepID=A0ABW4ZUT8_9BACL